MERWLAKVLTLIGCFVIPFVCTVLPVKVTTFFERKGNKGKTILSCLMCFGGGVFFATFILHMAPEARDIVTLALKEYDIVITYPLADLIMAMGFFLVLFVETGILIYNQKKSKKSQVTIEKCIQYNDKNNSPKNCESGLGASCGVGDKLANHTENVVMNGRVRMTDIEDLAWGEADCSLYGSGACCKDSAEVTIQANAQEDTGFLPRIDEELHEEAHNHEAMILANPHSSRALILLVALSFHRIFEGMSIGLQKSVHNVVALFLAVMCHESAIGFSLGLQFVKNKWKVRLIVLACFLCSLIMPLGVLIGTLMMELGNASTVLDLVNGCLQSLATGTFIYVTFFEILQEELAHGETSFKKVLSVFAGFAVMAALNAVPEEQPEQLLGHPLFPHNETNITDLV